MSFLFRGQKDKADKVSKTGQNTGPRTKQPILSLNHDLGSVTSRPKKPVNDEQVQELREFVNEYRQSHPCDSAYTPFEEIWLNDIDLYKRYLRATNNDIKLSKRRIIETLEWRRDFRPEIIPPDEVAPEATSGKHVLSGFDLEGRPILYLRPGRENTKASPRQIRYMVWSLERGINLMPPGQGTLTIIVDLHGASMSTMPSLSTARHVAHILQNHYVERLGRAFVCHMPRFFSAFFSALLPFLDPITKDKIRFNEANMTQFIPSNQLDDQFPGGSYPFEFDFSVYWPALVKACGIQPDGSRKVLQP
ncbi:4-nitrophenylphosphatase [Malassezia yamatoensis]|uniref:4-nitrophenylphosphatase n=1 Tax=Malassezia yamatoensis TaxID=253288 RepID=A0AAJ5YPP7_9BASI|nr:4-nitrophenylphosphatase [Malassezia yamatoensis]